MKPFDLRIEQIRDPLGLDVPAPRFSWKLADDRRGAVQTAYRIVVADVTSTAVLWDTGKVVSDRTFDIPYGGPPLGSRHAYSWAVQVWDRHGSPSPFSALALFETGVLNPNEWRARWIGIDQNAALLRKPFHLSKPVKRARVYVTARGLYRLHINGQAVGEAAFAPDWTDYRLRSSYQTHDVTALLRNGENAIGAWLGKGWFGSPLTWMNLAPFRWAPGPARLFVELHIEHSDNTSTVIASDGSWKGIQGPIDDSTLYGGEIYDARREEPGWDAPGFVDSHWSAVSAVALGVALSAQRSPTIQVTDTIAPVRLTHPAPGVHVFDLGQNLVGRVRLRVRGPRDTRVQLRHAEVLDGSGRVDTYNLRSARATDEYVLRGGGEEFFEPRFTYHGFRYVEVTGYPGTPTLADLAGRVVNTAAPVTGTFSCSNDLVNRIWSCVRWSQRGNLFSVPTDCPQRDERLGWMGDAQAFWRTACYHMDLAAFSAKWTRDVREAQRTSGAFQDVSPEVPGLRVEGTPFWADAGIVVPWTAWRHYGDTRVIQDSYAAMQKWLACVEGQNPNHVWEKSLGKNYGDWVAPSGNPTADRPVIATATWAQSARMMADMARAIGKSADAARYETLFEQIRTAFIQRFVNIDGTVGSGHQTPQALALAIGLVPPEREAAAVKRLVADIGSRGDHLSTGFVGTGYLLPVLSEAGHDDVAYRLLLQTTHPSWGYMADQGGTTVWENWDNDVICRQRTSDMCSFNHFCFGSVGEWLFRYLAGIDADPVEPGFQRLIVRPRLGPGITWAEASYESVAGPVRTRWENQGGNFSLSLDVPPNVRARVYVPAVEPDHVLEGGRPVSLAPEITYAGKDGDRVIFEVPAGRYAFTAGGVAVESAPRVGQPMVIRMSQPARAGEAYQLAVAGSNRNGIPVPGVGTIPLDPDGLVWMSLSRLFPSVFVGFEGKLDSRGQTIAGLAVPPMVELVGLPLWLAGVTFDRGGVNYISNGLALRIER